MEYFVAALFAGAAIFIYMKNQRDGNFMNVETGTEYHHEKTNAQLIYDCGKGDKSSCSSLQTTDDTVFLNSDRP